MHVPGGVLELMPICDNKRYYCVIEGEIQRLSKKEAKKLVYAELYELVNSSQMGRESNQEITLFDSVGIALEDYSALRLIYELAGKYNIGEERNLTPKLKDPKDLIATINKTSQLNYP